jgi:phosphoglycolate phosphatase
MALLLIDLDGTLVDPAPGIVGCFRHALEAMGRDAPAYEDLLWAIGPPLRQSFARLLGEDGDAEEAVRLYRQRYSEAGLYEADVYAGIRPALARLRDAGHRLFVCTAKAAVFARRVVAHFGLGLAFVAVHGAELDGRFEDKADLIADILKREAAPGEAACMVGDRSHDVVAAARHGIATVGVLWGYGGAAELREAGAFSLCPEPADLPAHVAAALAA